MNAADTRPNNIRSLPTPLGSEEIKKSDGTLEKWQAITLRPFHPAGRRDCSIDSRLHCTFGCC